MIGKHIGRYRIEGELGRGGMGVVYRATQVTLNRTVAVKMLPDDLARSEDYLSRFRREAETLARLQHPNIVHIYDVEEVEGSHFIIMEYVDGPTLSELMRREGRMSPSRTREIAHALADALTAAHRQGIVHRDIKPDNVLFTSEGRPKLTDFGVAHMRDSNVRTQTGVMLGTPYYMSPEQAGGKPVTAASDIYSLGVVLYEMLSGRVPFDADTPVAVALKHLQETPPPLAGFAPDIPETLCRIVDQALAKEPSVRFKSGSELQRSLGAIELGGTISGGGIAGVSIGPSCAGCGTTLDPEFLACPACGRAVRESCTDCGQLFAADRTHCPNCGSDAARAESTETQGVPGSEVREGLAAGLEGLKVAGQALVGAAADVAHRSADAAAGVAQRSAEVAGRAVDGSKERGRETAGTTGGGFASRLPAPLAGLPTPMLAGIGLVAVALLFALFQGVLGGGNGSTTLDGDIQITSANRESGLGGPASTGSSGGGPARADRVNAGGETATGVTRTVTPGEADIPEGANTPDPDTEASSGASTPPESESNAAPPEAAEIVPGDVPNKDGDTPRDEAVEPEVEKAPVRRLPTAPVVRAPSASDERTPPLVFDEGVERAAILAVVDRQKRSTENGNLDLFARDLVAEIRQESLRDLADLHEIAQAVRSTVKDIKIDFEDSATAVIEMEILLEVLLPGESDWDTAFDDEVTWELARIQNRWVITDAG